MPDEVNNGTQSQEEQVQVAGIKNSNEDNTYSVMPPRSLHGRKVIYTNEREITSGNVLRVLNDALKVHAKTGLRKST